jgi:transposase-like protein
MKTKINIFNRIKIALHIFMDTKNIIITQCNLCNGTHIELQVIRDETYEFTANYTCKDCGARALQEEHWYMIKEEAEQ